MLCYINEQRLFSLFHYRAGGMWILIFVTRGLQPPLRSTTNHCPTSETISIPLGAMNLPTGIFYTFIDTTSIPIGAMYLHARTFCTLADMISIPEVQCIYMPECSVHSLVRSLYPLVQCSYMPERSEHSLIQSLYPLVQCIYMHARTLCTR